MTTVLVLGATSPTAQAFVRLMQTDYPDVNLKLFVRNPNRLPQDLRENYTVIVGDGDNYDAYVTALDSVDYIYNSIGGLGTGAYTKILIKAIRDTNTPIKKVVDISAGGIYGEYMSGTAPYLSAVRVIHPKYTKDQLSKLDWYNESGLNFTIFRPGLIQNGPETQIITHTPDYRKIDKNEFDINRTTFARAAANAMFNGDYNNQSVSVSNGAPL
ncbi:NAD(P)H-binding protein [Lentilactobacillus sp. SPB1-3]|uniref:NAD(P)H-binding protein n=1 Tax=Lentilactobacillus terminaliae TaxID=3003483 RepID=A0ACD5DE64_9LACO|nr:NAD(P)H-binding protein [Lentilactobacillus sp. SPB1-3]MCZ0977725.1 NAD(P)H-binding protein [Lentilactobacillus sp. SPB1-3]